MKCIFFIFTILTLASANLPYRWWDGCLARSVDSIDDYNSLLDGELKNKFIVLDFYMQGCPYCYQFQNEFNKIIEDFTAWYGKEQIEFLKIDGQVVWEIS